MAILGHIMSNDALFSKVSYENTAQNTKVIEECPELLKQYLTQAIREYSEQNQITIINEFRSFTFYNQNTFYSSNTITGGFDITLENNLKEGITSKDKTEQLKRISNNIDVGLQEYFTENCLISEQPSNEAYNLVSNANIIIDSLF